MHLLAPALCLCALLTLAACDSSDDPDEGAPIANDDTATITRSQSVTFNVLANDTDPDGDDLDLATVNSPSSGTVVDFDLESGAVTYQAPGTAGTYRFDYTVTDGSDGTDTATVTVTVQ